MAAEQNVILYLPFNEAEGSTVAYDYGGNRHDATIEGGVFTKGNQGNCISFEGDGKAEIESNFIALSSDFTLLFWLKIPAFYDGRNGRRLCLFCNTSQAEEGYRELWIDAPLEMWGFFEIKKEGDTVSLYIDTQLMGTITLPATLTGITLLQDIFSTELAIAQADELKAFDKALTAEEVEEELKPVSQLDYYLDGVNFKDYGIYVESSQGLIDMPALKQTPTIENDNYHGEMVDLSEKRYQPREITLNCWVKATGKMDFTERVNRLYAHFRNNGTQRLMCSISPIKPLIYDVYCPEGIAQEKRWHDDLMIGTFALKLREPDPVKRVVRHQRMAAASANLSIAFKSDKLVTISWGDGTIESYYGDHTGTHAITHTYAENGVYYANIGGVIEEITNFSTNGIVIWQLL